jgi:hypothetical protein
MQNQIIYGTKLMASSAMKLSRKKYRKDIANIDIHNKDSI